VEVSGAIQAGAEFNSENLTMFPVSLSERKLLCLFELQEMKINTRERNLKMKTGKYVLVRFTIWKAID